MQYSLFFLKQKITILKFIFYLHLYSIPILKFRFRTMELLACLGLCGNPKFWHENRGNIKC